MDGLSVAANIIAVIEATHEVIRICYDFRAALKQSPWALTRILDEVLDLRNVLEKLEQLLTWGATLSTSSTSLLVLSDHPNSPLARCTAELGKLEGLLGSSAWKGKDGSKRRAFIQALGWRFKDGDVVACLGRIQRCKTTLHLALTADEA